MKIISATVESISVLRFEGNLDMNTAKGAQESAEKVIDGGAVKIIINIDKVNFVSSAGLRVLLYTAKRMKQAGGEMRVCGLNDSVQEIFKITGFDKIFTVLPGETEALASF